MSNTRAVTLYELNEVPWLIVDLFVERHPDSNFGRLLQRAQTYTTVNNDPAHLAPWRTWPTMHRSMLTEQHNSWELGQDPETFRGQDLWDVLDDAGYSVGLFGPLQSWPPRPFASGGFYVPDTFARDATTIPADLQAFQDFNLRMTAENSFSSDAALSAGHMAKVGLDLLRKGLTPASAATLARHVGREILDRRYKAARSMMQVVPAFDLYWRLHRAHRPALSVFFTNHVASMMHRYWGDAVPTYAEEFHYKTDPVYRHFVLSAMAIADAQLGKLMKEVEAEPGRRLIVASSMGQGPIQHSAERVEMLHLEDADQLVRFLDCGPASSRLAMYPMGSLEFAATRDAACAAQRLSTIKDAFSEPVFSEVEHHGSTVTFRIVSISMRPDDPGTIFTEGEGPRRGHYGDLGLVVRERLGGDNTAYHIPEGILLDYSSMVGGSDDRATVDVLDFAPSLLENYFGIAPPACMRGVAEEALIG